MKISVVICTHNRRDLLLRAIYSLSRQEMPAADFETLVIDNASTDGTRSAVEALLPGTPNLRYVYEPALGVSNARNRGVNEAHSEIIAFLDDDAAAEPGWLTGMLEAFAAVPIRPLCVGGRVLPMWEAPPPHWLPDFARGSLSVVDYGDTARTLDFPREWIVGCNMAFDREFLLSSAGRFDTRLGRSGTNLLSNEEIAVFRAVIAAGGVIRYEPAAPVRHLVPAARLKLGWFCRRMFAQGVSNVVAGPGEGAPVSRRGELLRLFGARSLQDLLPLLLIGCYAAGVIYETVRQKLRRP